MNLLLMQCLKHCNAASVEAALLTKLRFVSFVKTNELNHEASLRDLVLNIHDLVTRRGTTSVFKFELIFKG